MRPGDCDRSFPLPRAERGIPRCHLQGSSCERSSLRVPDRPGRPRHPPSFFRGSGPGARRLRGVPDCGGRRRTRPRGPDCAPEWGAGFPENESRGFAGGWSEESVGFAGQNQHAPGTQRQEGCETGEGRRQNDGLKPYHGANSTNPSGLVQSESDSLDRVDCLSLSWTMIPSNSTCAFRTPSSRCAPVDSQPAVPDMPLRGRAPGTVPLQGKP